jgi:hypothetical protein
MIISFIAKKNIYHYFVEYIISIFYWFEKFEISCNLIYTDDPEIYQKIEKSDYIICIQILHLDINKIKDGKKRIIIFNTEQNSRKTAYYEHILDALNSGYTIMDYHLGNIDYINHETNNLYKNKILYLPYLYCPKDQILLNSKKSKDVCFVGTITEDRLKMIEQLKKSFSIDVIQDFGESRDLKMSKYKIILNLNADPTYQVFETIRCYRCVFNKILVVSQQKEYKENNEIDSLCYFSSDENIPQTIKLLLDHYDKIILNKYKNKSNEFFKNWSMDQMEKFIHSLKKLYENNPMNLQSLDPC